MHQRISMSLACVAAAMIGMSAMAQTGTGAPPPRGAEKQPPQRDGKNVLSGPSMQQGEGDPRRADHDRARGRRSMELPPRAWLKAVEELELTEEQKAQVDTIMAEHREKAKAYATEHGKALQELREQMRDAVKKGEKPTNLREQLKAIQDKAPKFEDAQKKVWEILTPEQQEALKKKIETLREEASARSARQNDRRNQPMDRGAGQQRSRDGGTAGDKRRETYQRGKSPGSNPQRGGGAPSGRQPADSKP